VFGLTTLWHEKIISQHADGTCWYVLVIVALSSFLLEHPAVTIIHDTSISFRLTNFMELSPSWEVASCVATQELPSILWNPKVHCRVHNSPPLFPILSQISPVHTTPFYLSKIHFNMIHPPTSWSLSLWLSHQYPICIPVRPHSCYMPCPSHPTWLDHSNYTWRSVQVMKLLNMQFPPTSPYFIPLRSKYSPQHPVLKHLKSV
jgi:hypothetical protein